MRQDKGEKQENGIFSTPPHEGQRAHAGQAAAGALFELQAQSGSARAGILRLRGQNIPTPIFMPVGTQATVKGLWPETVSQLGAQVLLANTYHLHLRPGEQIVAQQGGLHKFMNWPQALLTDSGGFQVFSLAKKINSITDKGVEFQSHIDGARCFLSPETSMQIQAALGADIVMAFDECPPWPTSPERLKQAVQRSQHWLERCCQALASSQFLFGIVQGGVDENLRHQSLQHAVSLNLPGYALGGLSVGEPIDKMHHMVGLLAPELPAHKPRYLMGVGTPYDLIQCIDAGMDMFDCVLPTRMGRTASFWTHKDVLKIRNACYKADPLPIEPGCECYTCQNYSRAYLRHLFQAGEMLGPQLATLHNLHFYLNLMREARTAIVQGHWPQFRDRWRDHRRDQME